MTVAPTGPEDWYAHPLRPSALAVGALRAWWTVPRVPDGVVLGVAIAVPLAALGLLLLPATSPWAALACLSIAVGFGAASINRCRRQHGAVRRDAWAPLVVLWAVVLVLVTTGLAWAAGLVSLGAAEWMSWRYASSRQPGTVPHVDRWYSHNTLRDALVRAGVLPKTTDDGTLPSLGYRSKFDRDKAGREWQTVDLPAPLTWRDALSKHERIARSLDLPAERLVLDHEKGKPEGYVTFVVLPEQKALPGPVPIPDRTDFRQPIELGPSNLGRAVQYVTQKTHTLIVAKTRAGKSWLARRVMEVALLDPRTAVIVFSGKDPVEDWRPMRHLVAETPPGVGGYVTPITDEEGVDKALATIRFLRQVVAYRGEQQPHERFPLFVMFDEWMLMVETARTLNRKKADEMERQAVMLTASASGLDVHICFTSQRAVDNYLDSGLLANLGQIIVGLTRKRDEVRYALGYVPPILPSSPGEFLVSLDSSDPDLVQTAPLDDHTWAEVVIPKAGRLRADEQHPPLLPRLEPSAPLEPVDEPDDLTRAVHAVLKRRPDLTTSQLYDALPEDVRPGGANRLGVLLGAVPGIERVGVGERKRTQVWRLLPAPRRLPVAVPPDEQPVPLADALRREQLPPADAPTGPETPSTGTARPMPPALKAVP